MGSRTILYGYVTEAWHNGRGGRNRLFRRWNRRVLGELPPAASPTALLTSRIFAASYCDGFKGGYLGGVLHFGVSCKNIEAYWEDWLGEFEALLGRLYWEEAVVQMDSDLIGQHRFRWRVSAEDQAAYGASPPRLPQTWAFEGPFRRCEF